MEQPQTLALSVDAKRWTRHDRHAAIRRVVVDAVFRWARQR
jgi:hypothetical protein